MLGDLSGKTALITGGGQGVGRIIGRVLANQGSYVAIGDINKENAVLVAKEITIEQEASRICNRAIGLGIDVTSYTSVKEAMDEIVSRWEHLDILINNAAVVGASGWMEATEDRIQDWNLVLEVNVKGVVNCCKAVIPHMIQRKYGKIINISSTAGRPGGGGGYEAASAVNLFPYSISKAAVIRYTQCLASVLARHNINVNGIAPGPLTTEMGLNITKLRQRMEPSMAGIDTKDLRHKHVAQAMLFQRELEPIDVGKMAAFLASDDARNITGQVVPVDGGARML